jgi:hypothetical protein
MTIKNFAPYVYCGGTFIGREIALDANGKTLTGYGYKRSPNRQNRSTQEITAGWSHTIWRHPKYGALLEFVQHAYFLCNPWYGAPGPKNAREDAVWFDLRYVLPSSAPAVEYS